MEQTPGFQQHKVHVDAINSANWMPMADMISMETVVNLLIRKGICTPEEFFEEERKRHEYGQKFKNVGIVQTPERAQPEADYKVKKQNWLKRKMSKQRWSRKLGTALFGWQWKKVKLDHESKSQIKLPI